MGAEGQKTMDSMPPNGQQGAHYTQRRNKSQRYVASDGRYATIRFGGIFLTEAGMVPGN
jgi:hypothetical protein